MLDQSKGPVSGQGDMDSVKTSLSNGENVYLRDFGSFIVKHRTEDMYLF